VHGHLVESASDMISRTRIRVPIGIGTGRRGHGCSAWLKTSVIVIAVPAYLGGVADFATDLALRPRQRCYELELNLLLGPLHGLRPRPLP
jgi:hypothetical protein